MCSFTFTTFTCTCTKISLHDHFRRYIVGGDFNHSAGTDTVTAHFNEQYDHSIAIALQYVMNGFLRYKTNATAGTTVTNHPLPKKITNNPQQSLVKGLALFDYVSILMAFTVASFIIFPIRERAVGAKHLQVVSGVGPCAFWMSTFVWDLINYTILALEVFILLAAFGAVADGQLGFVFLIFMLYGFSVLPFIYLWQYLFTVPATAVVIVFMALYLPGEYFYIMLEREYVQVFEQIIELSFIAFILVLIEAVLNLWIRRGHIIIIY